MNSIDQVKQKMDLIKIPSGVEYDYRGVEIRRWQGDLCCGDGLIPYEEVLKRVTEFPE